MIIDGKKIAEEMLIDVKNTESIRLAAILIGEHDGSRKFLELKKVAAEKIGIDFKLYEFPTDITTQKLRKKIVAISKAQINHGILIELPLPSHVNTQYILNAIPQEKDIDVLSEKSQGAFFANRSRILPPSVETVKTIFGKYSIEPRGKNCVIFGYGLLVGKPISHWLTSRGATVSIINEFTVNPAHYTLNADIIISGAGKPNLIKADMIKEGAVIIDFGYNNLDGTITGDADFDGVSKKSSLITPVPGGVGPIVIASVLKNMLTLMKSIK
ncbi:MAG: bifunctional 5,10-methylenetetrahydrofolate dehydrogenase/5,10-methenyltetrahydrofolate cyclohydrolase [Patescibacteria group bacterium]